MFTLYRDLMSLQSEQSFQDPHVWTCSLTVHCCSHFKEAAHKRRTKKPQNAKVSFHDFVALQGYSLSSSSNPATDFELPSVSIPANGYTLIYTTGSTVGSSQAGGDLLTSLLLSSNGGSVVLLDGSGNIVSAVQYPR